MVAAGYCISVNGEGGASARGSLAAEKRPKMDYERDA
jgi:hypothetical protein